MAKTLISSPQFIGTPLTSTSRHGFHTTLPHRRLVSTRVKFSFHDIPPIQSFNASVDFNAIVSKAEGLFYTIADAAVTADVVSSGAASSSTDDAVQKSGGWFGFISEAMEVILKLII